MNDFKLKNLTDAVIEAERFIKKANAAIDKLKSDSLAEYGSKETAAAKRASMDLTRALVAVRNPYNNERF